MLFHALLLYDSHFDWGHMESQHSFKLYFLLPNDIDNFYVLIFHPHFSTLNVSVLFICPLNFTTVLFMYWVDNF